MDRLSGTCEREQKYIQVWWENVKGRKHLENVGVDGRIFK
jgi:hypothetical protein